MKQKSRTLLLQTLVEKDACRTERDLFQTKFGAQVEITVALCVRVSRDFSFDWATMQLLSPAAKDKCCGIHQITLEEGARERHAEMLKCLQAGQTEAALKAYEKAWQTSWTKSHQKLAAAFAECYIGDGA